LTSVASGACPGTGATHSIASTVLGTSHFMAFLLVGFRTAGVLAVAGFTGVSLWATKDRGLRPKNGFGATA
jgi:hypothetical protein